MNRFDLGALARAAEAEVVGGALPERVSAVGTDTRSLPPDSLFVALRGARFDGHEFVSKALQCGARAVMVDRLGASALTDAGVFLVVEDTLRALGDMAHAVRQQHAQPVVAITGSNGKTSTKELVAATLGAQGAVHKTQGNFNNLIGLPLTVFAWPEGCSAAVLEMGMNVPGEIARLTKIAHPTVGVITNIGCAHLEGLGTIENIARAKGELFAGLPNGATAVVNLDDPWVQRVCMPLVPPHCQTITFGMHASADVRIADVVQQGEVLQLQLRAAGESFACAIPLVGRHHAYNVAAAVAVGHSLGMSASEMTTGLANVSLPGGRSRMLRLANIDVDLLDDTYNANPQSMNAAFVAAADVAAGRRRIAVLGCMLELGDEAAALHEAVGRSAAESGMEWLLAFGPWASALAKGAKDAGIEACGFEDDMDALLEALRGILRPGDWVLAKGSRSMAMERAVAYLTERNAAAQSAALVEEDS